MDKTYWCEELGCQVTCPEYEDVVEEQFACPDCGEARMDYLVWDDGDYIGLVTCQTCGAVYDPCETASDGEM